MSKPTRAFTQANRPAPPIEQQRLIAEQTAAFLAKGGAIQQIPNGVSGQPRLGGVSAVAPAAKST